MPFTSQAQARFMYSQHPAIAKRWQSESPVKVGDLPERKKATGNTKKLLSGAKG
jgi:hypothetical protein